MVKGRTKLLKEYETKQSKKSYAELSAELINYIQGHAKDWIPLLCVAIKREHPLMPAAGIRMTVVNDWKKAGGKRMGIWSEVTIRHNWPDWMKQPQHVAAGKAGGRPPKQQQQISSSKEVISEQEREEEQTPISSQPIWDYEEEHPKVAASPFELLGDINRGIDTLWKRLTNTTHMPHMEDDVRKEYIIPSRPYFSDIVNGSSKTERDFLYNWLTWLSICIKDRIDIVEKADKTAYDRD